MVVEVTTNKQEALAINFIELNAKAYIYSFKNHRPKGRCKTKKCHLLIKTDGIFYLNPPPRCDWDTPFEKENKLEASDLHHVV
jgi:hypothetical protein